MAPALETAISSGRLILPDPAQADLVHLVRALASLTGVTSFPAHPATTSLADLIGPADHLIFVLLDGLGSNIVGRLPATSFLARHVRATIRSVSPSTTACALTSVATGHWPARHGVTGWFTHFADLGLSATPLPFRERFKGTPLQDLGLSAEALFPIPAFQTQMPIHRQLTLLPLTISHTHYARYSRGNTHGLGYNSISHSFDELIAYIQHAQKPTYTHLYIPDIDSRCHHFGVDHPSVDPLVAEIDTHLARTADALAGKARIVVTADHGLIDVPIANHIPVPHSDPLIELLRVPFSGDARMPLFHVKPDKHDEFASLFNDRYADRFSLLPMVDAERLRLFGPYPMDPVPRQRFGDYVAIATKPVTMHYIPPNLTNDAAATKHPFVAQHAGLSPEEMWIPVIVA
jgi:hypothetical protein